MYATHQKRMVRVTLDLMCYEDLDVDNLDWSELLGLEGDEDINVTVKDYSDIFQCDTSQIGLFSIVVCLLILNNISLLRMAWNIREYCDARETDH